MLIDNYLKYSGDEVIKITSLSGDTDEVINKVITKFGNTLYWKLETGKVICAEWVIPGTNIIRKLEEDDLERISGKYYLESYGEKFNG